MDRKSVVLITIIFFLFVTGVTFVSLCNKPPPAAPAVVGESQAKWWKEKHDGHVYVLRFGVGYENHGLTMSHDPDCPCHKKIPQKE